MSPTQPSLIETSLTDEWVRNKFENKNATIRVGTLFSGIGAIEHALERLKLKTEIVNLVKKEVEEAKHPIRNNHYSSQQLNNKSCLK